jgi:predicted AlkP superfamily pyrophosphatase or phosphodiesterase
MPVPEPAQGALPQTKVHDLALAHMAVLGPLTPKVLVVGLDGVRPDVLKDIGLEAFLSRELPGAVFHDAFAGGLPGTDSLQATLTAPGFTSILTGVWAKEHGIDSNLSWKKKTGIRSFLSQTLDGHPERRAAILAAWEVLTQGSTYGEEGLYRFCPDGGYYVGDYPTKDKRVVAEGVRLIEDGYDSLFLVIDRADHQGHLKGFSPESGAYRQAIAADLDDFARLVEAIKARPSYPEEDWLVLLTTDHGGKGLNHGGQSPEERTTFIISWDSQDPPPKQ